MHGVMHSAGWNAFPWNSLCRFFLYLRAASIPRRHVAPHVKFFYSGRAEAGSGLFLEFYARFISNNHEFDRRPFFGVFWLAEDLLRISRQPFRVSRIERVV